MKISLRNSSRILANLLPPTISQGANQRTYNVIFLSRDGFSDRIIFLCCKNIYSSLLFIVLFTAIRHFPIYFTLLCNFSWQLISLFDSWPVMPSLFFEMFVCFFPTRRYEHRLSEMHKAYQSFFFRRYPVIEQYCSLSTHLWFFLTDFPQLPENSRCFSSFTSASSSPSVWFFYEKD